MENNFMLWFNNNHETFGKPEATGEAAPTCDPIAQERQNLVGYIPIADVEWDRKTFIKGEVLNIDQEELVRKARGMILVSPPIKWKLPSRVKANASFLFPIK